MYGRRQKLESLQALRFIAAALVIWTHLKFVVGHSSSGWVVSGAGAVGVDIFFVLSGFVIAMTSEKIGSDWRLFIAHRIARVVPLYYVFSFGIVLVAALRAEVIYDLGIRRLWNSFGFLPLFDNGKYAPAFHDFGWTLAFEMWFYLLFGLAISLWGGSRARVLMPLLLAVVTVSVFPFYSGKWLLPRFVLNPLVLEFCAGALIFHFREKISARLFLPALLLLPVFAYGVHVTDLFAWHDIILTGEPSYALGRAAIWGGFSTLLIVCLIYIERMNWIGFPAWLVFLGDASYSIYLVQPFAMRLSLEVSDISGILSGFTFAISTILLGLLSHVAIERPLTTRARPFFERIFCRRAQGEYLGQELQVRRG